MQRSPSGADAKPVLLMVEDDVSLQAQMRWSFDGYRLIFARDGETAVAQLRRYEPSVVTVDLGLPPHRHAPDEGLRLIQEISAIAPNTKIIALTGQNDRANAIKCIGLGAHDFISKPIDPEILGVVLQRAFEVASLERDVKSRQDAAPSDAFQGILTRDAKMLALCRQVERLAQMKMTVLLLGESGTGKELFARALHRLGSRSVHRFVALNCAAIPENLLEAELFGFEKGAFTGAVRSSGGRIEAANHGTLFLDEIGDLPMALQGKLLRFLQDRVIERLGSQDGVGVDVRVVAATHRNLLEMISAGQFREDLYYRLAEMSLSIPALRERAGDAALLAHTFVLRESRQVGQEKLKLTESAIAAIEHHSWPGNVRQLENTIKRAAFLVEGNLITEDVLGLTKPEQASDLNLRRMREELERKSIQAALGRSNGNIARAADLLGVTRPTLYDLMARLGMRVGDR